ncbi:hypothetical protein N1851_027030 [Merluccius polli]|uniref:Uncharacterized protein n=1 Tax=Merluccius polli TaxID=89951 RepID=A0AA47MAM4_MERPO|nr:hypothetical protein N1851_027030 [Merluccius polli]
MASSVVVTWSRDWAAISSKCRPHCSQPKNVPMYPRMALRTAAGLPSSAGPKSRMAWYGMLSSVAFTPDANHTQAHMNRTRDQVDSGFQVDSGKDSSTDSGTRVTSRSRHFHQEVEAPGYLARFQAFTPSSSGSTVETRLKVRLANIQLEAQEKAQKLEHELSLQKLEIEAETKVKLKQLALQSAAVQATSVRPHTDSLVHMITRPVALPPFREAEVDEYFPKSMHILLHLSDTSLAAALHWPKDIWTNLLQCKFTSKAQDVIAALSLENDLDQGLAIGGPRTTAGLPAILFAHPDLNI